MEKLSRLSWAAVAVEIKQTISRPAAIDDSGTLGCVIHCASFKDIRVTYN
jgi:hypothetical protein